MKILFVSSCTSRKLVDIPNQLTKNDFYSDPVILQNRISTLASIPASKIYTGTQHVYLMDTIRKFRLLYPQHTFDINIISAGFGVLNEDTPVVPYEMSFKNLTKAEAIERSSQLNINTTLVSRFKEYDMVFVLLGYDYLRVLCLTPEEIEGDTILFLVSKNSSKLVPMTKSCKSFVIDRTDTKKYKAAMIHIKSVIVKRFYDECIKDENVLEAVVKDLDVFNTIMNNERIL